MKTRDLILQHTFALLLDKGYDGVSVSDIQQEMGIARGLLYHYFKSKEELFAEVVEQRVIPLVKIDKDKWKKCSIGEMMVLMVKRYEGVLVLLREETGTANTWLDLYFLMYQSIRYHKKLAEEFQSIQKDLFSVWKSAVLNSFAKGELKSGLNLESLARQFVYLSQGVFFINRGNTDDNIIEKGLRDFFEIIKR